MLVPAELPVGGFHREIEEPTMREAFMKHAVTNTLDGQTSDQPLVPTAATGQIMQVTAVYLCADTCIPCCAARR